MTISLGKNAIVVKFREPVRMLSSAPVGGGLLVARAILNIRTTTAQAARRTPEEIVARFARRMRLGPGAVGLLTAAPLEYAQLVARTEGGIGVLAVVTAGVSNALNIAERTPVSHSGGDALPPGTINTILVTDASVADECMVSTVISATEAKTAALSGLGVRSVATGGRATGTGTDAVVVVSGRGAPVRYAGGHTLFGQLVGEAVHAAVTRALEKRGSAPAPGDVVRGIFDL
jgi:iron complex transport system ATP-binding protein